MLPQCIRRLKVGGFLGEATAVEPEPYIRCLKTMVFWFNIKNGGIK